jgi:hypothetical protein
MKGNGQGLNLAGPLGIFLGRMDSFNAYFWAGLHSSRTGERVYGLPNSIGKSDDVQRLTQ